MASQELINSGKNLAEAQSEYNDAGRVGANEGFELATKNKEKQEQKLKDDEDREYELGKRQDEEFLRKKDIEEQIMLTDAREGALNELLQQGKENGLISDGLYNKFAENRTEFWKDQGNRIKFYEEIGDKEAFKHRLTQVTKGEQNWAGISKANGGLTISAGNPEALKIQRAIAAQTKRGTPPGIENYKGTDYFVMPDPSDPDNEDAVIRIPVDQAADYDGTSDKGIYGDYENVKTFSNMEANFSSTKPDLYKKIQAQSAGPNDLVEIGNFVGEQIKTPEGAKEIIDSVFMTSGFDLEAFAKEHKIDTSGGTDPNAFDAGDVGFDDKEIIKEFFNESLIAKYGEQVNFGKETLDQKEQRIAIAKDKSIIAVNQSKVNESENAINNEQDIVRQSTDTYNSYINSGDANDLIGSNGIESIKKNKKGTWIIVVDGVEVEAGDGDKPDNETIANTLGVPSDARDDAVDSYLS